jgi:hypothetical protein
LDLGRRARVTLVFSGLAALYPLGSYLSDNSAPCIERRYARENAAVIAALPEAYVTNAYPETGPICDEDFGCPTVGGGDRPAASAPDAGAVMLIVAEQ